jgi:hypothetical protein
MGRNADCRFAIGLPKAEMREAAHDGCQSADGAAAELPLNAANRRWLPATRFPNRKSQI